MLEPYLTYLKFGAIVGIVVAVFSAGYRMGAANVQEDFDEYIDEQKELEHEALLKRLAFNEQVAKRHEEETKKIKDEHEKEIAKIRGDFDRLNSQRLRVPKIACGGLPTTTNTEGTKGGNEGATESWELSTETTAAFRQYALDADEIVASCRALQNFVKTNGMAP